MQRELCGVLKGGTLLQQGFDQSDALIKAAPLLGGVSIHGCTCSEAPFPCITADGSVKLACFDVEICGVETKRLHFPSKEIALN